MAKLGKHNGQRLIINDDRVRDEVDHYFSNDMVYVTSFIDVERIGDFMNWSEQVGKTFILSTEGPVKTKSYELRLKRVVMAARLNDALRMTLVFKNT